MKLKEKFVFDRFKDDSVYFEIQSGEGGKESQSCSLILQRMYLRYFEKRKWNIVIVNIEETPEGIKKSLFKVSGKNVKDLLKEKGNHRFTRVSPFSKNKKLHTSFVGVSVEKVVSNTEIKINEKDISISFFKGSGAGGQHRNKVETGVRLIHKPTGIVSEAVSERSQHQNREIAYDRLIHRISILEEEKKQENNKNNWKNKSSIGFGERRRTYKLDAGFIKDDLLGVELRQIDKILDGDLSIFF